MKLNEFIMSFAIFPREVPKLRRLKLSSAIFINDANSYGVWSM